MNFHDLNTVWEDGRVVFYDIFRGLNDKVYAVAPLLYAKWLNAETGVWHPSFDQLDPPVPLLSRPERMGVLGSVFIDQVDPHLFRGGSMVTPTIQSFHWHATIFEFDVTTPPHSEMIFYYSVNGKQHGIPLTLPTPPDVRYGVTDTTMFRDDNEIIGEWIDHCMTLGFDHFFLYDNFSVEPLPDHPNVTVIPFPFPYYYTYPSNWQTHGWYNIDGAGLGSQFPQQMHALLKYGGMVDWMGFFDTDEYPNLLRHDSIQDFLSGDAGRAAVSLPSVFFGAKEDTGEGRIRERFVWRDEPMESNGFCYGRKKMLLNVKNLLPGEHVGIHDFVGRDPYANMRNEPFVTDVRRQADFDEARFNHYAQISFRRRDSDFGGAWSYTKDESIRRFM